MPTSPPHRPPPRTRRLAHTEWFRARHYRTMESLYALGDGTEIVP